MLNKNSVEVDVTPAMGKVDEVRNLGHGHGVMSALGLWKV